MNIYPWIQGGSVCLILIVLAPTVVGADDSLQLELAADSSSAAETVELSVPPMDHLEYPSDRPEWLDDQPDLEADVHTLVVVSGPSDSELESRDDLRLMVRAAVATYITQLVDAPGEYDFYSISDDQIDANWVSRRYSGELTAGDDTKFEDAVELQIDPQIRREIRAAWQNVEVQHRLGALGVLLFCGVTVLLGSSGLLGIAGRRIDRRQRDPTNSA